MWWEQHWQELAAIVLMAFNAGGMFTGFRGINRRLDRVNGQLDKHDDRLGAIERSEAQIRGSLGMDAR
jgi:hypothetical protein